jgi:hypothetical protein
MAERIHLDWFPDRLEISYARANRIVEVFCDFFGR